MTVKQLQAEVSKANTQYARFLKRDAGTRVSFGSDILVRRMTLTRKAGDFTATTPSGMRYLGILTNSGDKVKAVFYRLYKSGGMAGTEHTVGPSGRIPAKLKGAKIAKAEGDRVRRAVRWYRGLKV